MGKLARGMMAAVLALVVAAGLLGVGRAAVQDGGDAQWVDGGDGCAYYWDGYDYSDMVYPGADGSADYYAWDGASWVYVSTTYPETAEATATETTTTETAGPEGWTGFGDDGCQYYADGVSAVYTAANCANAAGGYDYYAWDGVAWAYTFTSYPETAPPDHHRGHRDDRRRRRLDRVRRQRLPVLLGQRLGRLLHRQLRPGRRRLRQVPPERRSVGLCQHRLLAGRGPDHRHHRRCPPRRDGVRGAGGGDVHRRRRLAQHGTLDQLHRHRRRLRAGVQLRVRNGRRREPRQQRGDAGRVHRQAPRRRLVLGRDHHGRLQQRRVHGPEQLRHRLRS